MNNVSIRHGLLATLLIFGLMLVFGAALGVIELRASSGSVERIHLIASRALLDRPQVAAVIVGAINTAHLQAHEKVGSIQLDAEDLGAIEAVTDYRRGPREDVYTLERDRTGRHGQIMKYQLSGTTS